MTTRIFSVLRRKAGLIDLITPLKIVSPSVKAYRLKTDTTPHGAFGTTVITAPRTGFVDASVAGAHNVIQPGENVRIILKPSEHGLSDTAPFWLKLVYIDETDAEMVTPAPSAPTLIGAPGEGYNQIAFTGAAPVGVARVDLPRAMANVRILNLDTTNTLMVAFQEGGGEVTIPFGKEHVGGLQSSVSSFWIRGVGGAVNYSFTATYAR